MTKLKQDLCLLQNNRSMRRVDGSRACVADDLKIWWIVGGNFAVLGL